MFPFNPLSSQGIVYSQLQFALQSNHCRAVPVHPLLTRAVYVKRSPRADMLGRHSLLCFTWTILIPAIAAVTSQTTAAKLFCENEEINLLHCFRTADINQAGNPETDNCSSQKRWSGLSARQ